MRTSMDKRHITKRNLDTPCLVLDLDVLEANLRTMQAAA